MKVFKALGVLLFLVMLLVGGLFFYGINNIDSLIKEGVEKYGTEAAGVNVTLDEVKVVLGEGRIELRGLTVANPPGYTSSSLFFLGETIVQVSPDSLTESPIVIDLISIDSPMITVEEKGLKQTNLSDLAANLKSASGTDSKPSEPASTDSQPASELPRIAVTALNFSHAKLSLVSEKYGGKEVPMPTFTANQLGGNAGLPPDQLATALLTEVVTQAKRATESAAKEALKEKAREKLKEKIPEDKRQQLDQLKSLFGK